MSVRRMAKDQPESFSFSAETEEKITFWLSKYPEQRARSAVVPLLWLAQKDNQGWLSRPAMETVAKRLDMAFIRVYEVASFYTMFNLEPVGRWHVQLCGTTPCMLRGAEELKSVCQRKIGSVGTIAHDGALSWVEVECLGACVNAPMVQINDDYYEDLTPEGLEALLDDLARGTAPPAPGPQNTRHASEPLGGALTLKDPELYKKQADFKVLPNRAGSAGE